MMRSGTGAVALPIALLLSGSLHGCAVYATFAQCRVNACSSDAAITTEVRRLFREHPAIDPPNLIDIQTLNRVVYLYGLVDTDEQKQLAEAVAREANGVTRVVDAIGIDNEGR